MSQDQGPNSIDLIRWTFTINPAHRDAIEGHLADLGLDVLVQGEELFVVTWEEPDRNVEDVVEELWEINGEPFEVTQEDFRRVALHTLHHSDDEAKPEAA
jgi:hypothetical protein